MIKSPTRRQMASFYDTPDPPACISYPDGAPTTMTAARWGTLSPAPTAVTVTLTTECPSPPWGHRTSPALWVTMLGPASLPASPVPCAYHLTQRTPRSGGSPKEAPRGGQGPHSPPAHHPACCHSLPATFLAAMSPGSDLTGCGGRRAGLLGTLGWLAQPWRGPGGGPKLQ